jgi:hypothetical protein
MLVLLIMKLFDLVGVVPHHIQQGLRMIFLD